jgi:hypothetical protein
MCALLSLPAHAGDWVISQAGGSVIEIPGFFGDGVTRTVMIENEHAGVAYEPNGTISLRQYRLRTSNRPFAYLGLKFGFGRIQYSVDEMSRGMVSGDDRHGSGFYAACRREPGALACFELHYDSDYQSDYADIISRVARSFAKNIRP